jgi:hypothetical protein
MSYARQMLDSYSGALDVDAGLLATTIDSGAPCRTVEQPERFLQSVDLFQPAPG